MAPLTARRAAGKVGVFTAFAAWLALAAASGHEVSCLRTAGVALDDHLELAAALARAVASVYGGGQPGMGVRNHAAETPAGALSCAAPEPTELNLRDINVGVGAEAAHGKQMLALANRYVRKKAWAGAQVYAMASCHASPASAESWDVLATVEHNLRRPVGSGAASACVCFQRCTGRGHCRLPC